MPRDVPAGAARPRRRRGSLRGRALAGLLDSPEIQRELQGIAAASGQPFAAVLRKAEQDLAEMRAARTWLGVRLFAALSRFVYRRGYHPEPICDLDEVERVRAASQRQSVIFLVTHKTYLDFFVLFDFLHRHRIAPPYIFGGLNMNFAGFGALARRAGGIFIRRSFREDAVYKAVLQRFIESLVEQGASFMWAVEGTRSRTGKLLMPRLGLLNYVGRAGRRLGEHRISYIPVSVVYDQIPDVADMAAEEAGAAKRPESFRWFLEYLRGLRGPFGSIHIGFGEAMSISDTPDAPDLEATPDHAGAANIEVRKLAFEVCYRINEITPATLTSLVVMVLLCRGRCDEPRMRADVAALRVYLRESGRRLEPGRPSRNPGDDPSASIEALLANGVIARRLAGGAPMLEIAPGNVSVAIYYSNMAVHHFVNRAFTELALLSCASAPAADRQQRLWSEFQRLRGLFKFEFFFPRTEVFRDQLTRELDLFSPQWRELLQRGDESVLAMLELKPLLVAAGVLSPFVASYQVVGEVIAAEPGSRRLAEGDFVARCLARAQGGTAGTTRSVPGVSRALLANGLRVADNRGLRTGEGPDADSRRGEFLAELEATQAELRRLDAILQSGPGPR